MEFVKENLKDIFGESGYTAIVNALSSYWVYIVILIAVIIGIYMTFIKPSKSLHKLLGSQVKYAWEHYKVSEEDLESEEKLNKLVDKVIAGATKKIEDPTFKIKFKTLVLYLLHRKATRETIIDVIKYHYSKVTSEE